MMVGGVSLATTIKELLDDDTSLRRRFRACARTRRSTSPEEVEHWCGVLRDELHEEVSAREVEAALGELTIALMPNSLAAEALASGLSSEDVPTVNVPTGTLARKDAKSVDDIGGSGTPVAGEAIVGKGAPGTVSDDVVVEDATDEEHLDAEPDEPVKIESAKDIVVFLIRRGESWWGGYFENLCRNATSLRVAGGREFFWKSTQMGWSFSREEIEDALFEVAGKRLPGSLAGRPHAYYEELHTAAKEYLDEHGIRERLTADEEAEHVERAFRVMTAGDRRGYRRALREWVAAARDAADSDSSPSA